MKFDSSPYDEAMFTDNNILCCSIFRLAHYDFLSSSFGACEPGGDPSFSIPAVYNQSAGVSERISRSKLMKLTIEKLSENKIPAGSTSDPFPGKDQMELNLKAISFQLI